MAAATTLASTGRYFRSGPTNANVMSGITRCASCLRRPRFAARPQQEPRPEDVQLLEPDRRHGAFRLPLDPEVEVGGGRVGADRGHQDEPPHAAGAREPGERRDVVEIDGGERVRRTGSGNRGPERTERIRRGHGRCSRDLIEGDHAHVETRVAARQGSAHEQPSSRRYCG